MTLFTLGVEQPNDPDEYEHLALVAFGAAAEYAAKAKEDDFLVVEAFARNRRERGEDGTVHRNLELVATRVELTGE
jgi:hypothetical protein